MRTRWGMTTIACLVFIGLGACSPIPSKFIKQAEPGTTLTALITQPSAYSGKIVILGGVIVEERKTDGRMWLHIKNRPLDVDYEPHRDTSRTESESGFYWIVVDPQGLPPSYKEWARLTVVGRVMPPIPDGAMKTGLDQRPEPILGALYLRGWGYGLKDSTWESTQDPNYIFSNSLGMKPSQ